MKILAIGLNEAVRNFLAMEGMTVFAEELRVTEDLCEWILAMQGDAVVIDSDVATAGTFIIRHIRNSNIPIPVIGILREQPRTKLRSPWLDECVAFLNSGGDDFLKGPADPRELNASLHAVVRRYRRHSFGVVKFVHGGATVEVNTVEMTVSVNGNHVVLTPTEASLLCLLASGRDCTESRSMLFEKLYPAPKTRPDTKTLDVFISRLRKKLGSVHADARDILENVYMYGYRMTSQEQKKAVIA